MVKGLISQFTTNVSIRPWGRLRASFTARQSIWIIIGHDQSQLHSGENAQPDPDGQVALENTHGLSSLMRMWNVSGRRGDRAEWIDGG